MSSIIAHGRRLFKSSFSQSGILQRLLSVERVEGHCRAVGHRWRDSFWSPSTTILTCVLQSLGAVKSLRAAVAELLTHLAQHGRMEHLPSIDPSAFAQARQRVPEAVFKAVLDEAVGHARLMAGADAGDRWCGFRGFRVLLIDGSSVSMPDTPDLQRAFPQSAGQATGCGFPIARIVTLFDWASGVVTDFRVGSKHDSETALFRTMLEAFQPGTVALADRYYCSYVDIARLMQRGAQVVFRNHQRRPHDFRKGTRLGQDDCLVTWRRPEQWLPSFGISREEFEALPEEMTVRMVRTTKTPRGFRSREIVIITTILDPSEASKDELLALYRDRWMAELNLRSLKTTLGMEVLRGKSVDIVRKELIAHLLAYNLIRLLMWEAARAAGRDPRRLSFAGTLHRLQTMAASLLLPPTRRDRRCDLLAALLVWIGGDVLPDRPGRFEPRRVKRRPKNYSRLTKPRSHYHRHGDHSCR